MHTSSSSSSLSLESLDHARKTAAAAALDHSKSIDDRLLSYFPKGAQRQLYLVMGSQGSGRSTWMRGIRLILIADNVKYKGPSEIKESQSEIIRTNAIPYIRSFAMTILRTLCETSLFLSSYTGPSFSLSASSSSSTTTTTIPAVAAAAPSNDILHSIVKWWINDGMISWR
jgi:hypothetical protein